MTANQMIALLLILTWLAPHPCLAGQGRLPIPKDARLTWSELAPIVVDRPAKVRLTDGTKVEGGVLAVRPDSLVFDITRTSGKQAWPKGQCAIPRASVAEFRLVKDTGPLKLVGGILGTIGGVATSSTIAIYGAPAAAMAGFFFLIPVMAVAGYYAGKAADVRTRRITLLPDTPPAKQLGVSHAASHL